MEKIRSILVPLILVAALAFGVWAYMDSRNARACDRWRADYRIAFQNILTYSGGELEDMMDERAGKLEDERPEGCRFPEIDPR